MRHDASRFFDASRDASRLQVAAFSTACGTKETDHDAVTRFSTTFLRKISLTRKYWKNASQRHDASRCVTMRHDTKHGEEATA